jgi:hypothetical protein
MEDPAGQQPQIPHGNRNTGALRGHIPPHILRHMGDKFHDFRRNHVGRVQLKLASKSLPLGLPDAVCSPVIRRLKPAAIHGRPLQGQLNTPYSSAYGGRG